MKPTIDIDFRSHAEKAACYFSISTLHFLFSYSNSRFWGWKSALIMYPHNWTVSFRTRSSWNSWVISWTNESQRPSSSPKQNVGPTSLPSKWNDSDGKQRKSIIRTPGFVMGRGSECELECLRCHIQVAEHWSSDYFYAREVFRHLFLALFSSTWLTTIFPFWTETNVN